METVSNLIATAIGWVEDLKTVMPPDDASAKSLWGAPSVGAVEDKVIAEIATFAHVASALGDQESIDMTHRLLTTMASVARPQRHLNMLRSAPHVAWPLGIAHAVLERNGIHDDTYAELLNACLSTGWNEGIDRARFRQMEMRWAQALLDHAQPIVNDLWPSASWIVLPAFLARREDVYAITHAIFYATDFGNFAPPQEVDLDQVTEVIDIHIAHRAWEDDLDLVAELALAAMCLKAPCRYLPVAIDILVRSTAGGLLPAAGFRTQLGDTSSQKFLTGYHTSLVLGMIAVRLLCDPIEGTGEPEDPRLIASGALDVLRLVGDESNLDAIWVTHIEEVRDAARSLSSFVLDAGLSRSCHLGNRRSAETLLGSNPFGLGGVSPALRAAAEHWLSATARMGLPDATDGRPERP